MYFDMLKDIKTHAREELYGVGLVAEENARIRPNESVINARKALEIFTASVLADHQITIPSRWQEKERQGLNGLDQQIKKCLYEHIIDQKTFDLLDDIRKEANKIVHVTYNEAGNPERYEIINVNANIEQASNLVKMLYEAIINHYIKGDKPLYLNTERLPFGKYEVVELVKKIHTEAAEGNHNYICRRLEMDENQREQYEWVYLRAFKKDPQGSYERRDNTALNEMWKRVEKFPENVVTGSIIETASECSFTYIKYEISQDTFTLANREKMGRVTGKTALQIIEKLIIALLSLQKVKEGTKIHHRGIRPEFVFITPTRKSYHVQLGCFETSKIAKENENEAVPTVYFKVVENQNQNPFAPAEIRGNMIQDMDQVDWEKVDVYSLGVLLLWILGEDIRGDKEADVNILFQYYGDYLPQVIDQVLNNSLNEKPSLSMLLEAVRVQMEFTHE